MYFQDHDGTIFFLYLLRKKNFKQICEKIHKLTKNNKYYYNDCIF